MESISLDEEPPSTEDTKPTILASMKAELPSATLATTPAYADQIQPSQEQPLTEGSPEDTEAFAWLDGLAAKQGADEAMLLESDQRMNTPPGWVIQSLQTEVTDSSEPDTTAVPDWLKHKDPDDEFQELVVASNFPDWLKPTTPVDEVRREQSIESNVPELPKWLSGADAKEEFVDIWGTSEKTLDIAREPRTTGTVDTNKPSDVSEISSKKVDLNEAGLSDLEHLPGIGFSKAQAILEYRSIHGPFKSVDELANVAGISERILDEFRDQVTAGSDEYTEAVEQPVNEHQVLLLQARNALVLGDIQAALRHYQALIKQRAVIPEVISDLNEALYRFPVDVYIWETLGDAHARSGNLQEALNAYTKAEEYIR